VAKKKVFSAYLKLPSTASSTSSDAEFQAVGPDTAKTGRPNLVRWQLMVSATVDG